MSRTTLFAVTLGSLAAALSGGAASAGNHYYGGYGPTYYVAAPQPCCNHYVPPPSSCCHRGAPVPTPYYAPPYAPAYAPAPAPVALPPPPLLNWSEGAKYYSGAGAGVGAACYQQHVRIPDPRGGWAWGVKSACDRD